MSSFCPPCFLLTGSQGGVPLCLKARKATFVAVDRAAVASPTKALSSVWNNPDACPRFCICAVAKHRENVARGLQKVDQGWLLGGWGVFFSSFSTMLSATPHRAFFFSLAGRECLFISSYYTSACRLCPHPCGTGWFACMTDSAFLPTLVSSPVPNLPRPAQG